MNNIPNKLKNKNYTIHSQDPYILQIHNFIDAKDIPRILDLVEEFHTSTQIGSADKFGRKEAIKDDTRTSKTAWCQSKCEDTFIIQKYIDQVQSLIQINKLHYESLQFLKYDRGEYYRRHHDYYSSPYPLGKNID